MRLIIISVILGSLVIMTCDETVRGDGGTIRLSRREGEYRISVFTTPTPFRAGPVDISVLVQNAVTGTLISDAQVVLLLTPCNNPDQPLRQIATSQAATNKLLKTAVFELPHPGCWSVEVVITGERGSARVHFELKAAGPRPQWPAMWPWIGWLAPVIMLFSIHEVLVWRKRRPTA